MDPWPHIEICWEGLVQVAMDVLHTAGEHDAWEVLEALVGRDSS